MRQIAFAILSIVPALAYGQSGGFITRLGDDVVQVERFSRTGNRLEGTVVVRAPAVRMTRWSMIFDDSGRPLRYEADAVDVAGNPVLNGASGSIAYDGDSITRAGFRAGQAQSTRIGVSAAPFPGPSLPYIGVSNLMYEMALGDARRRGDSAATLITLIVAQAQPQRVRTWMPSADSMELDYFGVARSGWRFDPTGRLLRADWRNTTYGYRIERVERIDVDSVHQGWAAMERSGRAFGALSRRDSVVGAIDGHRFTIDYSRPSKRGRPIWGNLVPNDRVWRLGADMATHFTTDVDLDIAGTSIPAGRYTLWMIPSATSAQLIISRAVNVFGTMYDASKDLARIPLHRSSASQPAEQLTIEIRDGALRIAWDDTVWSAPVKPRGN
jgi:hypothetical protein